MLKQNIKICKVNDGNTWINICPTNAKIIIEGPATETGVDTTNNV